MKQRRSFIIKRSFQLFLSLLLLHSSTLFAQTELTGFFDVNNSFEFDNEEGGFEENSFILFLPGSYFLYSLLWQQP